MNSTPPPTRPARFDVRETTTIALFAAVLAASAWISIPIGTVPITLQVFAVLLAGLLLRPLAAFSAVGVYVLMGAANIPVFANGTGGWGVLFGPTGGYIFGFLLAAPAVAVVAIALSRRLPSVLAETIGCAIGVGIIYALGWTQLAVVTGMGLQKAFFAGVAPFILLDAAKAAVAVGVAASVRRAGVVRAEAQA